LLLSAALFSIMGCFLKLASNTGIPSTQLVFFRAVFQGTLVLIGLCTNREPPISSLNGINSDVNVNISDKNALYYNNVQEKISDDEGVENHRHQPHEQQSRLLIFIPFGSNSREVRVVVMRGIFGGMGFVMYFFSIKALPLGDAITLFSLYPIHTLVLAYFFLGEPIQLYHVLATIASVVGATLIAGPTFLVSKDETKDTNVEYNPFGYVTAFIGSFFGAFVITLIRKAGTLGVSALQLLFSWAVFGVIFSLVFRYILFDKIEGEWITPQSQETWFYIFGMCTIGSVAHFLLNYAGRMSPAGLASIVRSSDVLFAYVGEVWVFGVVPTWTTILGVIFVLSSLIYIAVQKWYDEKTNNVNNEFISSATSGDNLSMKKNSMTLVPTMDEEDEEDNQCPEMICLLSNMK